MLFTCSHCRLFVCIHIHIYILDIHTVYLLIVEMLTHFFFHSTYKSSRFNYKDSMSIPAALRHNSIVCIFRKCSAHVGAWPFKKKYLCIKVSLRLYFIYDSPWGLFFSTHSLVNMWTLKVLLHWTLLQHIWPSRMKYACVYCTGHFIYKWDYETASDPHNLHRTPLTRPWLPGLVWTSQWWFMVSFLAPSTSTTQPVPSTCPLQAWHPHTHWPECQTHRHLNQSVHHSWLWVISLLLWLSCMSWCVCVCVTANTKVPYSVWVTEPLTVFPLHHPPFLSHTKTVWWSTGVEVSNQSNTPGCSDVTMTQSAHTISKYMRHIDPRCKSCMCVCVCVCEPVELHLPVVVVKGFAWGHFLH